MIYLTACRISISQGNFDYDTRTKRKSIYNPPKNNYQECDLMSHFINFLDNTLDNDPNTVFVCGGDLNHLDLNRLQSISRPGVTRV